MHAVMPRHLSRAVIVAVVLATAFVLFPVTSASAAANPWPHVVVNGFATPSGEGGWLTHADGTVEPFGDARAYGDASTLPLNGPVIGGAATPDGLGYWLVAADGGIFSYGSARFHGSMGGVALNQPVFSMAPTPTGNGYWLVAYDGGIFSFGDARFYGSMGGTRINEPVTGITTGPAGTGYRMVARDGGIFSFGTAPFLGSGVDRAPGLTDVVGMAPSPSKLGYWIARANGVVYAFGDAPGLPTYTASPTNPVVAMFSNPVSPGYALVLRDGSLVRRGVAPGGFAAGVHRVGADGEIPAGTYRNRDARTCYWARLSDAGAQPADVIEDQQRTGPHVVTITASDEAFTSDCSGWAMLNTPVTASTTAAFRSGTYVVGLDVAAGAWTASGATAQCAWERRSGFTGAPAEVVESGDETDVAVTLAGGDAGFSSSGCGTWTKT